MKTNLIALAGLVLFSACAGANGQDGVDGVDGKDGRDGIDGMNGTNGINGLNGADGKDGTPGVEAWGYVVGPTLRVSSGVTGTSVSCGVGCYDVTLNGTFGNSQGLTNSQGNPPVVMLTVLDGGGGVAWLSTNGSHSTTRMVFRIHVARLDGTPVTTNVLFSVFES